MTVNIWRAHNVLKEASTRAEAAGAVAFAIEPVSQGERTAFERVPGAGDFRAAAEFAGSLFVCGRSSLIRYDSPGHSGPDGGQKQEWSVGSELPPFPLVTLAVRRGIGSPELWIATDGGGVLIYDGQVVKQLVPAAMPQRRVSALLPLSNGRVLIGTEAAGLYVTDGKHLELLHPQFARMNITALAGDGDEVWAGTRGEGVWMWGAGEATHFQTELPDRQVLSLYANGEAVWVGTPIGVAEFSGGRFRRRLAEGVFAQSIIEHAGTLSIGTIDEGLVTVALQGRTAAAGSGAQTGTEMNGVANDVVALFSAGGEIWAVSPGGLWRPGEGETIILPAQAGLHDGHVAALDLDRSDRLWVGYFDRGLDVIEQGGAGGVRHLEDDVLFCVNRIKEDPEQGTVAVGTANGLALFDSGGQLRETLTRESGLASSHVTDLVYQRGGAESGDALAIATPAGISFIDRGTISSVSAFQGLVNNHVYTLAERDGGLLAGTLGGFSLLRRGTVEASFTTANSGMRQNWVTASAAEGKAIYLGTYGAGVMRVEGNGGLTSFREFARERVEINPNAMLVTGRAVYAGTAGQGLAILPRGDERWHFVRGGLPSLSVTALAERNGTLYVGTDNGLVRAAERKLGL